MSTTLNNVEYKEIQPTSTIAELRQRALIYKADAKNYSIKRWVNSVYTLYEQVSSFVLINIIIS